LQTVVTQLLELLGGVQVWQEQEHNTEDYLQCLLEYIQAATALHQQGQYVIVVGMTGCQTAREGN
jgi:hypothetical protein